MTLRATGYRRHKKSHPPQDDWEPPRMGLFGYTWRAFRFFVKWGVVLGIWAMLFLGGLAAWYARELPEITRSPQFVRKPSITVMSNDGNVIARYGDIKGDSLNLKDMSPHLIEAVLATEDRRFYYHFGIDPIGLARAIFVNLRHKGVLQGGSTITQQLAKNLFLTQERTIKRKIQEALLALWLEKELTKNEILTAYLNRVYMGSGAYGVDAAAQVYFRKSARDLTLREAAMLAGLLKAPSRYSPKANPDQAEQRANVVIAAMRDAGYLKEDKDEEIARLPIPRHKPVASDSALYFADWVVEQLDDLIGTQEKDIVIETTLDPDIQKLAADALSKSLNDVGETRKISQGSVLVTRRDGAVVAMVGGRDYEASQFNRATHALRPPGSSFKPFVYLTALEAGWTPDMMIEDGPIEEGRYRPSNFDGEYYGQVPLNVALAFSLNTATVRLMQMVGVGPVLDVGRRLGITSTLEPNLSTALGSNGVSQLEMTGAYDVLASGGLGVVPYGILSIKTNEGQELYQRPMDEEIPRVFSSNVIQSLNHMLAGVIDFGTGAGAKLGEFAAGKTGTSQDYRDAWFIGFTNSYVTSVWLGNDDNSSMKRVTGGSFPAQIWRQVMTGAMGDPTPPPDHTPRVDANSFSGLIDRVLSFPSGAPGEDSQQNENALPTFSYDEQYFLPGTQPASGDQVPGSKWRVPPRQYND